MPQLVHRVPKYRLHRASGQAVVTLDGQDHYLGKHGSPASRREYDRVVAEWLVSGRQITSPEKGEAITINQLFVAYWNHVEKYYRKDGRATGEVQALRYSLQPVINMFGDFLVTDFGPLQLKAVRESMIARKFVRRLINHRVHRIRRMFRWGVENALVSPVVLQGLIAVSPLKVGRTLAPESEPVRALPEEILRKTQKYLPREVTSMTDLQWITGMRPGEVVRMRACDIDRSRTVWAYTPESHKTQHHGFKRIVPLGPKAQAIISPFIKDAASEAYLFSPFLRIREWLDRRKRQRQTPMTPSQRNRRPKRNPLKRPGQRYTTDSYAHAIASACKDGRDTRIGQSGLKASQLMYINQCGGRSLQA